VFAAHLPSWITHVVALKVEAAHGSSACTWQTAAHSGLSSTLRWTRLEPPP
jgi:hypothetical protein